MFLVIATDQASMDALPLSDFETQNRGQTLPLIGAQEYSLPGFQDSTQSLLRTIAL